MAGYSGTPLPRKLGLRDGHRVVLLGAVGAGAYRALLGPGAPAIAIASTLAAQADVVHIFTASREALAGWLPPAITAIAPDGMIWVSWPKKASNLPSDVTEDTIRDLCLPLGLVDVKVCAVDAVWSGLKLVIRKELRGAR